MFETLALLGLVLWKVGAAIVFLIVLVNLAGGKYTEIPGLDRLMIAAAMGIAWMPIAYLMMFSDMNKIQKIVEGDR